MSEGIEIYDKAEGGHPLPELDELLELLDPACSRLVWSIMDLEPNGIEGVNYLELKKQIDESPVGLVVSWDRLLELARAIFQTVDCTVVGCRTREQLPASLLGDTWIRSCEVGIQAIDSTLWSIYARDERLLEPFKKRYSQWAVVPTG